MKKFKELKADLVKDAHQELIKESSSPFDKAQDELIDDALDKQDSELFTKLTDGASGELLHKIATHPKFRTFNPGHRFCHQLWFQNGMRDDTRDYLKNSWETGWQSKFDINRGHVWYRKIKESVEDPFPAAQRSTLKRARNWSKESKITLLHKATNGPVKNWNRKVLNAFIGDSDADVRWMANRWLTHIKNMGFKESEDPFPKAQQEVLDNLHNFPEKTLRDMSFSTKTSVPILKILAQSKKPNIAHWANIHLDWKRQTGELEESEHPIDSAKKELFSKIRIQPENVVSELARTSTNPEDLHKIHDHKDGDIRSIVAHNRHTYPRTLHLMTVKATRNHDWRVLSLVLQNPNALKQTKTRIKKYSQTTQDPIGKLLYADMRGRIRRRRRQSKIVESAASRSLYHVTFTKHVPSIKEKGLTRMNPTNWVKAGNKERYGGGEIYAFEHEQDAVRWAGRMDWEHHKDIGSGKISIVKFADPGHEWEEDDADPLTRSGSKGKWLKSAKRVQPRHIQDSYPVTLEHVKKLNETDDVFSDAALKLANHPDESKGLHTALARKSKDPRVLTKLASHPSEWVRNEVAQNHDAPQTAQDFLAHDSSWAVRGSVAQHSPSRVVIDHLKKDQHHGVLERLAKNPHLTGDDIHEIYSQNTSAREPETFRNFARHLNTHPKTLHLLAHHEWRTVKQLITQHPNASAETLDHLAKDPDWMIRSDVAAHPNTSPETTEKLYNDRDGFVRSAASRRLNRDLPMVETSEEDSKLHSEALRKVALDALKDMKDGSAEYRAAVAAKDHVAAEIAWAKYSTGQDVGSAAYHNEKLDPATKQTMKELWLGTNHPTVTESELDEAKKSLEPFEPISESTDEGDFVKAQIHSMDVLVSRNEPNPLIGILANDKTAPHLLTSVANHPDATKLMLAFVKLNKNSTPEAIAKADSRLKESVDEDDFVKAQIHSIKSIQDSGHDPQYTVDYAVGAPKTHPDVLHSIAVHHNTTESQAGWMYWHPNIKIETQLEISKRWPHLDLESPLWTGGISKPPRV